MQGVQARRRQSHWEQVGVQGTQVQGALHANPGELDTAVVKAWDGGTYLGHPFRIELTSAKLRLHRHEFCNLTTKTMPSVR